MLFNVLKNSWVNLSYIQYLVRFILQNIYAVLFDE